jgi:hypothetical protein
MCASRTVTEDSVDNKRQHVGASVNNQPNVGWLLLPNELVDALARRYDGFCFTAVDQHCFCTSSQVDAPAVTLKLGHER